MHAVLCYRVFNRAKLDCDRFQVCHANCRCDADGVEVVLEVKAHNTRAIGLYRRHGFADVGLRRKYYADGSDALLMTRHAGAAAVSGPAPGADASTAAS